jgi:putative ABC transport system permease protein
MLALHRTLSVRYLRQRWSRAILVVASISLGVATLVATEALRQSVSRSVAEAATPLRDIGDLFIGNGDLGVPIPVLTDLRAAHLPAVAGLDGMVIGRVALLDLESRSATVLGLEVSDEGGHDPKTWGVERKTDPLAAARGVFGRPVYVGADLARDLEKVGWQFRVRAGGAETALDRIGTIDAHGPSVALGGSFLFMQSDLAAKVLGRPGFLSRVAVRLTPGTDLKQAQKEIEAVVAGRADVGPPQSEDAKVHDVIGGVELGLVLGGLCALVVGLFLVYNAMSVSVAERRHDIGILRAVGATRAQIAGLFAGEACFLGLVGSLLGIPLGLVLGRLSVDHVQQALSDIFLPLGEGGVLVDGWTITYALTAGVLTSLLASLVPALQAAREEPADAVRRVPPRPTGRGQLFQAAGSLLLIAVGVGLKVGLANRTGLFIGLGLMFLGALMATPLLAGAAAILVRPLARHLFGIAGRLAADNLARSPGRTGLVIAALAAGAALLIHTAGLTLSSEEEVLNWIDDTLRAELFVTCNSGIVNGGSSQPLRSGLVSQIEALEGVEHVAPVHFDRKDFRGKIICLIAMDGPAYAEGNRPRGNSPYLDTFARLREPRSVMVSDNFATANDVHIGDAITLPGIHGPVDLHVIGTITDYTWSRGTLFVDFNTYRHEFGDTPPDILHVFTRPDAAAKVRETIARKWGGEDGLIVTSRDELRPMVRDTIRRLYGLAYAQELVVSVVAALGVVTALLISVLQRRRELGLLRAVGASQGQVLRSVLTEAVLMGLIGAVIGLCYGLPLEWYAVRVVLYEETGFSFPVRVPWLAIGVVLGMSLLASLLAGLGPAIHAMRLRIPDAIAYE